MKTHSPPDPQLFPLSCQMPHVKYALKRLREHTWEAQVGSYNLFIGTVIKETSTVITGVIAKYNRTLSFIVYSFIRLEPCRWGKNNLFFNFVAYVSNN